jgi:hypothetical protein
VALLLIVLSGVITGVLYKNSLYDFVKDVATFIKPIFYLLIGFYFIGKIKNKDFLFSIIVKIGVFFAVIHLIQVTIFLLGPMDFSVSLLRHYGGKDNFIELLALLLIVFDKRYQTLPSINKKRRFYFKWILIASLLFYFSRTMIVAFLLMLFSIKGYLTIRGRTIKYIVFLIIGLGLFYAFLNLIHLEREATGLKGFLYKLKVAPTEILSSDVNKNSDHAELWDKWRGYEALKALEQVYDTKLKNGLFFGKGFGALVDLEFEAPVGNQKMQYIPIIHNGYVFTIFKTGLLGLLFYLLFLIYIYSFAYLKPEKKSQSLLNNLISSISVFYFFSTLIITGLYNKSDVFPVFLGGLFFLKYFKEK